MIVERNNNEIVIRISSDVNIEEVQRFLNYLRCKETFSKSKATQAEADQFSQEANQKLWEKNKDLYLKEWWILLLIVISFTAPY